MVATRAQTNIDPFNHILDNVFNQAADSPLRKSLQHEGIDDIFALVSLAESEIDALQYTDENEDQVPLPQGYRPLLYALLGYIMECKARGNPIASDGWTHVTAQEFNEYRISSSFIAFRNRATRPSVSHTPSSKAKDPVESFRRGIKHEITYFTVLKDDKQWDTWNRSTMAQARAQDVDSILDPAYIPVTIAEKELFQEKQKYMYAVFERNLLTDYGKLLVRQHADNFDAQAIYSALSIYALQSTKAALSSSNLLSYITSAHLGHNTWKGTTTAFILHWQEQVRRYEQLVPSSDHCPMHELLLASFVV